VLAIGALRRRGKTYKVVKNYTSNNRISTIAIDEGAGNAMTSAREGG
jgi:hypothetical protein